jgi:hypothetical protein
VDPDAESAVQGDPDATDTQVLPVIQGEWLSETEFAPFEDGPDTLTPPRDANGRFLPKRIPGVPTTATSDAHDTPHYQNHGNDL